MNELNKLYRSMLMSWGGVIKDDGKILFTMNNQKEEYPVRIDEHDLYLPLSEVLDGNCMDKAFFHPACENITSKETEVFKIIRKMTTAKLLDTFRNYPAVLFGIASQKPKGSWRQDILDMLEPLKGTKRTVRDELSALFARMNVELEDNGLDNRFIHFKVTKGGGRSTKTGEKVYYKTKAQFPFYNEITKRLARSEGQSDNQQLELNNFSVSRGALKLAQHLFQCILPIVQSPDDIEYESTSQVAARLISYLGAYAEIADQLNRVQNTFRADFDKMGLYPLDTGWMEHMDDLGDWYRQVPMLDYNSHNTNDENDTSQQNVPSNSNMFSVNRAQQNQNQQQPQNTNQNNNQPNLGGNVNVGDYDTTVPQMQPGDKYLKTEIDYMNNKVLHYAINTITGGQVVYQCTRYANVLGRIENNNMMGGNMMGMGMGMPGMGGGMGNMGMMGMMPQQMMMMPNGMGGMMMMPQSPTTASSAGGGMVDFTGAGGVATF